MRTETVEARGAFFCALAEVRDVVKSKTADTGKYKYDYATLEQVLDSVKTACSKHGLTVSQEVTGDAATFELRTTLIHETGTVEFAPLVLPLPRDAQALGSAATYARRYSLVAIFAIAVEDDDGQEATRQARNAQQYDGNRTAEELAIRKILAGYGGAERKVLTEAFKAEFRGSLADLAETRHHQALGWLVSHAQALLSAAAESDVRETSGGSPTSTAPAAAEPQSAGRAALANQSPPRGKDDYDQPVPAGTDPPATPLAGPSRHDATEPPASAEAGGGTQRPKLGSRAQGAGTLEEAAKRAMARAGMLEEGQ